MVLLIARSALPGDARWWLWTCTAGLVMGLFALWYVPFLKRRRARAAAAHHQAAGGEPGYTSRDSGSRDSGSNTVSSTDTPGSSTRS